MKYYVIVLTLLMIQVPGMLSFADASEPELWPISIEGKWGYIDANGTVKIEPQYAGAAPFSEGLALVSVFGTSEADRVFDRTYDGFIDKSGQFVIPAEFPSFYTKREDYDSYGYSSFEDGVAIVRDASSSSGLRGLIDRTGKLLVPMKFNSISWFGEGLCVAELELKRGQTKSGYMNYEGQFILQPQNFLYGLQFSEGRATITIRDRGADHKLLIDRKGNVIVGRGKFSSINRFQGGLSRVVKGGKVGLIGGDGQEVVRLGEYDQIMEPDPGSMYIGERKGAFYAIGSDGAATRLPNFGAEPVRYRGELIWIMSNEKSGYARPDGTSVVEPVFDDLYPFDGELVLFRKGDERGYVNRSGRIVWSTKNWELPLQYSIRDPLKKYLPDFGLEAMPLSYNWDCENAIVFVCDGNLEKLRKFYLDKRSADVEVRDDTDYESEPGKLSIRISFEGVAYLEVYAMSGDKESKNAEGTDNFVSFYHCESMSSLRKKHPDKIVGIILEN